MELVRRAFAGFGISPSGIEEASRSGLFAADAEFDFPALYPDGPTIRGLGDFGSTDSLPWGLPEV